MRFSGIFQTISFTVRKRSVNAFLPPPYTVAKLSKNAPKTAKKIRNACGKNPHPLPPSCGSQSPKNRFVRPFFGILQVLAPKTPARWPFSHSSCVFTSLVRSIRSVRKRIEYAVSRNWSSNIYPSYNSSPSISTYNHFYQQLFTYNASSSCVSGNNHTTANVLAAAGSVLVHNTCIFCTFVSDRPPFLGLFSL